MKIVGSTRIWRKLKFVSKISREVRSQSCLRPVCKLNDRLQSDLVTYKSTESDPDSLSMILPRDPLNYRVKWMSPQCILDKSHSSEINTYGWQMTQVPFWEWVKNFNSKTLTTYDLGKNFNYITYTQYTNTLSLSFRLSFSLSDKGNDATRATHVGHEEPRAVAWDKKAKARQPPWNEAQSFSFSLLLIFVFLLVLCPASSRALPSLSSRCLVVTHISPLSCLVPRAHTYTAAHVREYEGLALLPTYPYIARLTDKEYPHILVFYTRVCTH